MAERPAATNLNYTSGDDILLQFTTTQDGSVLDITGMTPAFVASRTHAATAVISSKTSPQTATPALSDPENGVYTIAISDAVTDGLSGTYLYESEVEDSSGDTVTVAHGYITFHKNLT